MTRQTRLADDSDATAEATTPLVRSLRGSLRGIEIKESDYRRYLEKKFLGVLVRGEAMLETGVKEEE